MTKLQNVDKMADATSQHDLHYSPKVVLWFKGIAPQFQIALVASLTMAVVEAMANAGVPVQSQVATLKYKDKRNEQVSLRLTEVEVAKFDSYVGKLKANGLISEGRADAIMYMLSVVPEVEVLELGL